MANGTVTITVKVSDGTLLSGATVSATISSATVTATTNSSGVATFTDVTTGTYSFAVTKTGYAGNKGTDYNTVSVTAIDDSTVNGDVVLTYTSANICPGCAHPYLLWDEGGTVTEWGFDIWWCEECGYVTFPSADFPDPTL